MWSSWTASGIFWTSRQRRSTRNCDLLSIAQKSLCTLRIGDCPSIRDGKLIGQVSRRDVLAATHRLMEVTPQRESSLLYLSALNAAFHQ
jgi:hypothetical protein